MYSRRSNSSSAASNPSGSEIDINKNNKYFSFNPFSDDYDSNAVHNTLRDQIYLSKEDPEAQLDSMHARLEQLQLEKLKRASKLKSKRSSSLLTKETVIA